MRLPSENVPRRHVRCGGFGPTLAQRLEARKSVDLEPPDPFPLIGAGLALCPPPGQAAAGEISWGGLALSPSWVGRGAGRGTAGFAGTLDGRRYATREAVAAMSIKVMGHVWKQSRAKGTDRLLLLCIADYADDYGVAWPSVPKLAERCLTGERNVRVRLRRLAESGELIVERQAGRKGTNRYRIPVNPNAGVNSSSGVNRNSVPPEPQFIEPLNSSSAEPSRNHQESSDTSAASIGTDHRARMVSSTRPPTSETSIQAEAIYQAYPKHVGKTAALKAITKVMRKVPHEILLARVRQYAASRQGQDPQFTPHPATWFNHGRYEDDPQAWVASAQRNGASSPPARPEPKRREL